MSILKIKNRWTGIILYSADVVNIITLVQQALKSGAYLGSADLRGANLYGANLGNADLGGADLRGTDLRGADDSGCKEGIQNEICSKCGKILTILAQKTAPSIGDLVRHLCMDPDRPWIVLYQTTTVIGTGIAFELESPGYKTVYYGKSE